MWLISAFNFVLVCMYCRSHDGVDNHTDRPLVANRSQLVTGCVCLRGVDSEYTDILLYPDEGPSRLSMTTRHKSHALCLVMLKDPVPSRNRNPEWIVALRRL